MSGCQAQASFAGPLDDDFQVAMMPPPTMGTITNNVYFDGSLYTYVHTVNPSLNNNQVINTQFNVNGFTGTAGWSFSDAFAAGGSGISRTSTSMTSIS